MPLFRAPRWQGSNPSIWHRSPLLPIPQPLGCKERVSAQRRDQTRHAWTTTDEAVASPLHVSALCSSCTNGCAARSPAAPGPCCFMCLAHHSWQRRCKPTLSVTLQQRLLLHPLLSQAILLSGCAPGLVCGCAAPLSCTCTRGPGLSRSSSRLRLLFFFPPSPQKKIGPGNR